MFKDLKLAKLDKFSIIYQPIVKPYISRRTPVKKFSIFGMTLVLAFALMALPVTAGEGCGMSKASADVKAKFCSSSKTTTADAKADDAEATMVNATDKSKASSCVKTCGVEAAKACGAAEGVKTADADAKEAHGTLASATDCPATGKCQDITLAIKGMTCTGCEAMITKALAENEGVYRVRSIDYKTGVAEVCVDPTKVEGARLASVVTNAGYETSVSHAAAVHEAGSKDAKACAASKATANKDKKVDY